MNLLPRDKKLLQQVGENIKLARLRRQLSAEMVAERAGISRTTLWHLEKGATNVSFAALVRVLGVLGLSQDLLLIGKDDVLGRKLQDIELTTPKRAPKKSDK